MIPWIMFAVGATSPRASHSPLLCDFIASAGSPWTKRPEPKSLKIHAPISDLSRKYPILISLRNSHPQLPPNHILTKKVVGAGSNHQVTPPSGLRRGDSFRLRLLRPTHACRVAKLMTLTAKEAKGYSRRDYIHPFSLEVLRWLS